jgi:hypothetical protein
MQEGVANHPVEVGAELTPEGQPPFERVSLSFGVGLLLLRLAQPALAMHCV